MGLWDDLRRFVGGKPVLGPAEASPNAPAAAATRSTFPSEPGADARATPAASGAPGEAPAVQVLVQGPLTDLKRTARYLASVGVESQLIMPPGGCGT